MQFGHLNVLVDPFFSRGEKAFPVLRVPVTDMDPDAIFVTHGHLDHALDVPSIACRTGSAVYAATSVCGMLHDAGIPARQLHPLAAGRGARLRGLSVRAIPARHVRFDLVLILRALWRIRGRLSCLVPFAAYPCGDVLGYQFETPWGKLLHFGSLGWHPEDLTDLCPDVALLPMQGHSRACHIVLDATKRLRPGKVIPHHHDDFYPPLSEQISIDPLEELVREGVPESKVIAPGLGEWLGLF